jgi:hypothetical protein
LAHRSFSSHFAVTSSLCLALHLALLLSTTALE